MRFLLLALTLSGCTINMVDKRVDPAVVDANFKNIATILTAYSESFKELQDKGYLSTHKEGLKK